MLNCHEAEFDETRFSATRKEHRESLPSSERGAFFAVFAFSCGHPATTSINQRIHPASQMNG